MCLKQFKCSKNIAVLHIDVPVSSKDFCLAAPSSHNVFKQFMPGCEASRRRGDYLAVAGFSKEQRSNSTLLISV